MSWRAEAACRGMAASMFFAERGAGAAAEVRAAKAVCAECEVRQACLDDAIATGEWDGVRGGLSARERRRFRRGSNPVQDRLRARRDQVRVFAGRGLAPKVIASLLGVSENVVYDDFKALGLQLPPIERHWSDEEWYGRKIHRSSPSSSSQGACGSVAS